MRILALSILFGCALQAQYFGGGSADSVVAVLRDADGFLYAIGNTQSKSLPISESAAQSSSGGEVDIFVMKIARDGSIVYSTYFGGTGSDIAKAAAMDGLGHILVVGSTTSTNFPATTGASQTTIGGTSNQQDAFLVSFDLNESGSASVKYATYLGGADKDAAYGVTATAEGRVVVVGFTASTDFPMRGVPFQGAVSSGWDAFVADFDVFGTLSYSTYLGGDRTDIARAVAVASDGSIVVAGSTMSSNFPIIGEALQNGYAGGQDGFITRLSTATGLITSSYFGGSGLDDITAATLGANGRLVLAGFTTSDNLPTTTGAAKATLSGETDAFVAVIDLNAPFSRALTYASYLGGSDSDVAYGVAADSSGRIYVTGYTKSTDMRVTSDALQSANAGGASDAFLARFDPSRGGPDSLVYSTYIGGAGADIGNGVVVDSTGAAYVAGSTSSRRVLPNAPDRSDPIALSDGFIVTVK